MDIEEGITRHYLEKEDKEKLYISFDYWEHECGDGCCYEDGTSMSINGVQVVRSVDYDEESIVRALLEHLGITNFTTRKE